MPGVLAKIFGSTKVVGAAMKGMDALVFTDEERTGAKIKILKSYEAFKIAQRLLALIFSIPYAASWLLTFLLSFVMDVTKQVEMIEAGYMGEIVVTIIGFYFLCGAGEGISRAVKGK